MNDESLSEVLFDEPGEKIKKISQIIFWVEVVACVILAFSLGWEEINRWGDKEFRAGIFFGFLIGGPLAAYCSSLLMYGFGELVDNIGRIRIDTHYCFEKCSTVSPSAAPAKKKENHYVDSFVKSEDRKTTGQSEVKVIVCDNPNFIKCPSCGLTQNANHTVCSMCGQRFTDEMNIE